MYKDHTFLELENCVKEAEEKYLKAESNLRNIRVALDRKIYKELKGQK